MLVLPDNQDKPAPGEWKAAESALRVWRFAGERPSRPTPPAPPAVIGQAGRAATVFAEGRVSRLDGVGLRVWDFLARFFRRRDAAGDDFTPEMLLARRRPLVVRLPATGAFRPVPALSVPRRAVPDPRIPEQPSQQTSERVIHKTLYAFVTRTLPFRWEETDRPAVRLLSSPAAGGPTSLPSSFLSPPLPGRRLSPPGTSASPNRIAPMDSLGALLRRFATGMEASERGAADRGMADRSAALKPAPGAALWPETAFWQQRAPSVASLALSRPPVPQASWLGVSPGAPSPADWLPLAPPLSASALPLGTLPRLALTLPPPAFAALPEMVYGTRAFVPRPLRQVSAMDTSSTPAQSRPVSLSSPSAGSAREDTPRKLLPHRAVRLLAAAAALSLVQPLPPLHLSLAHAASLPMPAMALVTPMSRQMPPAYPRGQFGGPQSVGGFNRTDTFPASNPGTVVPDRGIRQSAAAFPLISALLPRAVPSPGTTAPGLGPSGFPQVPSAHSDPRRIGVILPLVTRPLQRGEPPLVGPRLSPAGFLPVDRLAAPMKTDSAVTDGLSVSAVPRRLAQLPSRLRRGMALPFALGAEGLGEQPAPAARLLPYPSPFGTWPVAMETTPADLGSPGREHAAAERLLGLSVLPRSLRARLSPRRIIQNEMTQGVDTQDGATRPRKASRAASPPVFLPVAPPFRTPQVSPPAFAQPFVSEQRSSMGTVASAFRADGAGDGAEVSRLLEESVITEFQPRLLALVRRFLSDLWSPASVGAAFDTRRIDSRTAPGALPGPGTAFRPAGEVAPDVFASQAFAPQVFRLPPQADGDAAASTVEPWLGRRLSLPPPVGRSPALGNRTLSVFPAHLPSDWPEALPIPLTRQLVPGNIPTNGPGAWGALPKVSGAWGLPQGSGRLPNAPRGVTGAAQTASAFLPPMVMPVSEARGRTAPAFPARFGAAAEDRGVSGHSPRAALPPRALPMILPVPAPLTPTEEAWAIQRVASGSPAAAPAGTKSVQPDVNLVSQEKGAAANDVHLLANEVWSLLKRRLETEAERLGRR